MVWPHHILVFMVDDVAVIDVIRTNGGIEREVGLPSAGANFTISVSTSPGRYLDRVLPCHFYLAGHAFGLPVR